MNLKQAKKLLNDNIEKVLTKLGMNYEVFGDNIYSICPIHESSDNPRAFSFSKQRGIWKCWTRQCETQHKNDVFGLIQGAISNKQGFEVSFGDVLAWIRKELSINIDGSSSITTSPPLLEEETEFDKLVLSLKDNIKIPDNKYINIELALNTPSKYFINRGFKAKTLCHFNVGDCYDKQSKLYERAIIPIYNSDGKHKIGLIGRAIKEYRIPKFLIYPVGFDKRYIFYNMHNARPHIEEANNVYLVEGQSDVWKLYEAGIYNVLGMFGRTLSKEQEKILQQLPITNIIILTDNDQAGRESKIQLQRQLGRFYKLTFPKLAHKDVGDMSVEQIHKMLDHNKRNI